jgi:RNA polymerase-binding transcription factor DksA
MAKAAVMEKKVMTNEVVKTKPNSKGGVDLLTEQAVEHSKEFKNGIPKNPGCTLSYEDLCKFFYHVIDKKDEANEALTEIKNDLSVEGKSDGGNGLEDAGISHSSINNDGVNLLRLTHHLNQAGELAKIETSIMEGKYKNICLICKEPIPLLRMMFVPEAVHCANCAKHSR